MLAIGIYKRPVNSCTTISCFNRKYTLFPDLHERTKFVLASYNIGYGHVRDAMKLAEKYGSDPYIWDNSVEEYLLKKSEPEYYNDPVVTYGYCRGTETYNYVREIMYRYDHYMNMQDSNLAQLLK